jgi:hypothetical protein
MLKKNFTITYNIIFINLFLKILTNVFELFFSIKNILVPFMNLQKMFKVREK